MMNEAFWLEEVLGLQQSHISCDQAFVMSDTYHLQLYKKLGPSGRITLAPFIHMLWEHGLTFTPSALNE